MELQRGLADFEAANIWVVAISNDPVGALAQFCDEHAISFEFLSDADSRLIRELGILNTLIEPDESIYGIPFPGSYLLDERGTVIAKYFHREYQVREVPALVLADGFGEDPRLEGYPRASATEEGITVEVILGAPELKYRERANLHVRCSAAPGWRLAARPDCSLDAADSLEMLAIRGDASETRVEVECVARDVESLRADMTMTCRLVDPEGSEVVRDIALALVVPLGDLNRARRA